MRLAKNSFLDKPRVLTLALTIPKITTTHTPPTKKILSKRKNRQTDRQTEKTKQTDIILQLMPAFLQGKYDDYFVKTL